MTPSLIRAARAGLNWTQQRLAQEAEIHPKAVAYWERPGNVPGKPTVGAIPKIMAAFARHGVTITGSRITFPDG